jgi:histidyl-tRNA synthetase
VKIEAPPGTHDVLAKEWPHWDRILRVAERLCSAYGYRPIATPVFEDTELFARTSGVGSDVVQKEMYTFVDRGDRSLTLRPEATAPIARAYLQRGLHREPQPQKLFTIATMYRYARPQRGRYREHWHLSVEAIGSEDPAIDAELVQLYDTLLRTLDVADYRLEINSIGDRQCRPQYVEALVAWLDANDNELDEEARQKKKTSPLRVFDVKSEEVRAALVSAPTIDEFLCDECREHFAAVQRYLDAYHVQYEVITTLVRGLDYYTRTTWEFIGPEGGAQSAISGGGRYDYLIEEIGGPSIPGVGFGAGIERLHLALGDAPAQSSELDVFFVISDPSAPKDRLLALMAELRQAGLNCDTDYAGRSLGGQIKQGERLNARTIVLCAGEGATVRRKGEKDEVIRYDPALIGLRRAIDG